MTTEKIQFENYEMRLLAESDLDNYFESGFANPDDESCYYSGCVNTYNKDQIKDYIKKVTTDESRFDFLILTGNEIVGEVVLNDIEGDTCHYRICIFDKKNFSKGIGRRATIEAFKYAFDTLGIKTIDLEVFPFNERGIALYKKLGFKTTDQIIDEDAQSPYRDIIIMELSADDFRNALAKL